ncbi:MAG: hypothetical protein ABR973_05205 [Candidatus Acidiferrales bacterium]
MKILALAFAALALVAFAATPARAQSHNVALTWAASASAAANPSLTYNVYRSPGCSGTFTLLNSSAVSATSFHRFRRRAWNLLLPSYGRAKRRRERAVESGRGDRSRARAAATAVWLRAPRLAGRLDSLRRLAPASAAEGARAMNLGAGDASSQRRFSVSLCLLCELCGPRFGLP